MQFRAEAFNLFNQHAFNAPGSVLGSPGSDVNIDHTPGAGPAACSQTPVLSFGEKPVVRIEIPGEDDRLKPLKVVRMACGWFRLLLLLVPAILINKPLPAEPNGVIQPEGGSQARSNYRLGVELYKNGKLQQAEQKFRKAVELQPDFSEALNDLGVILDRLGRHEEALESFRRAARCDPKNVEAGYNYAVSLLNRGAYKEAQSEFERVIHLSPRMSKAHDQLGRVYARMGDAHSARIQFEQAISMDPQNADARYSLAQLLRKAGDTSGAAGQLSEFERLKQEQSRRDDANRSFRAGTLMAEHQDWANAIQQLRRAVQLNPELTVARFNLAGALRESGDIVGALEQFQLVVRDSDKWSDAHYELAQTLARLGDGNDACDEYRATIGLDKTFVPAYQNLAAVLYKQGKTVAARQTLRDLLKVDPSNTEAISVLAAMQDVELNSAEKGNPGQAPQN